MTDKGPETRMPTGGETVYADYIRELVDLQDRYKASMEQRAIAVITTSSTLAALLFGFTTLAHGQLDVKIPQWATVLLVVGVIAFAAASTFAIIVNAPRKYEGPTADALRKLIDKAWADGVGADEASYQVAEVRLTSLQTAKEHNAAKAGALAWAIRLEVIAVALLAAAIVAIAAGW